MHTSKKQPGSHNIVGAKIKEARKLRGVRQQDLVAMMNIKGFEITQSKLSQIELQYYKVYDYEVVAIAKALNVSVLWLLGIDDSLKPE